MLDNQLLQDVTNHLGFPSTEFVHKDYYVVELLKLINNVADLGFIFSGGTCIAKAFEMVQRMSEDIDYRIDMSKYNKSQTRKRMSKNKAKIIETVNGSKIFSIDIANDVKAKYENTHIIFKITYPDSPNGNHVLANKIKLELSTFPVRLPTHQKEISSFISKANGQQPDISNIKCVNPLETLAEKIVALTRRATEDIENDKKKGITQTLLRHLYDIYKITPEVDSTNLKTLVGDIINSDIKHHNESGWTKNPKNASLKIVTELKKKQYKDDFEKYTRAMIYDTSTLHYDEILENFEKIINDVF